MGVYLGSNNLLGGGSGSGALLSDPREMNRTHVYMPRCEIKAAESSHGFLQSHLAQLFNANKGGSYTDLAAADTYVTTHDITSSTNGGGVLRLLALPSLYQGVIGDSATVRITLDGEEYVISTALGVADSQGYYRPLMGNFVLGGMANISTAAPIGTVANNFGNHYRGKFANSDAKFTNGFISGSDNSNAYTYVPTFASNGQLGGVRFKESLKVEFKADKFGAGSYVCNRVGSLVTTF